MKIADIHITTLDIPFTPHAHQHLQYWIPQWRIVQVCRITLENGVVGWGETLPNAMGKIPDDIEARIVGCEAGGLLWQDELGGAVQMALFDAVGKALDVPVHRLLGSKMRSWCPLSWWTIDMLPGDWARQCAEAVKKGYTSSKLKARTSQDVRAGIRAILEVVPPHFRLDLDFNGSLANAAQAVEFLKTLEQYEQVAMIETPIPQRDVAGYQHIRQHLNRPVAIHLGDPPIATALTEDVTDGYIIGGGAGSILQQATICEVANKPFWLQMIGTGITTTWAAHFGAVCTQARWPAITCMNIYQSQLIEAEIKLRGGLYRVPDGPGLGIEVDQRALEKYAVDYLHVDLPRHLYRYARASGETTYYGCISKSEMHGVYTKDAMPICEAGSSLEPIPDDGSRKFKELYRATRNGNTVRRLEKTGKKRRKK